MAEKLKEQRASGASTNGRHAEISASIAVARARLEKSGGKLLRGAPEHILADLDEARQLLARQREWEAERVRLGKEMSEAREAAAASRTDAQRLVEEANGLVKVVRDREAHIVKLETSLAKDTSRLVALEDREKRNAEREAQLDRSRVDLNASLEDRRREVLALMEEVRTDLTRVAALEARERAVHEREGALDRREEHLRKLELDNQDILQRNLALNIRFEEFNASLVKRLDEASAREEMLEERARTIESREKAVEAWKLDLANREADLSARFDELLELERQKQALQSELGQMRERRLAEIEQAREALRAREAEFERREKEATAVARALAERNVRLIERKQAVETSEAQLASKRAELEGIQRELVQRAARIEALEGRVASLEGKRKELAKTLAKMRSEL